MVFFRCLWVIFIVVMAGYSHFILVLVYTTRTLWFVVAFPHCRFPHWLVLTTYIATKSKSEADECCLLAHPAPTCSATNHSGSHPICAMCELSLSCSWVMSLPTLLH